MPKVELNGIFKKGFIIVVSMAFGAGVAWSAITFRVGDIENDVADHEARLRDVETAVIEARGNLTRIEQKLDTALDNK